MESIDKEFIRESELSLAYNYIPDDSVEQFWLERLVRGRLGSCLWSKRISGSSLYQEYSAYCAEYDLRPYSFQRFYSHIHQQFARSSLSKSTKICESAKLAVHPLSHSRRMFLESHPNMFSAIAQNRIFSPQPKPPSRTLSVFSSVCLFVGFCLLIYQIFEFLRVSHWNSFSLLRLVRAIGGDKFAAWANAKTELYEVKWVFVELMQFSELAAVLLILGFLIKANQD